MTFSNLITALAITGYFLIGFSQLFLPSYTAWNTAMAEYRSARSLHFIAESFRRECEKPDRNIENWKKAVSITKELESYEITELWQGDMLRALKLISIISGKHVEIIGACAP